MTGSVHVAVNPAAILAGSAARIASTMPPKCGCTVWAFFLIALVATSCESYKDRPPSFCIQLFWLVVWNIFFTFPYIGNNHPTDFHIFWEGLKPPTSVCLFVLFCFVFFVCLFVFSSWPILDSRPTQYMEFDVTSSPAFSPHDFLSGHMAFCTFIACKWYRYNVAPPVISWFISWFTSARN